MAVRFSSADNRIYLAATLPDPAATGLTVVGWWRIRVNTGAFATYYRTSDAGTIHSCATFSSGDGVNVFTTSGELNSNYTNAVDEWVSIAVVANGADTSLYVRPAGGATISTSGAVGTGVPAHFCVGGRSSLDATEWLNGSAAYVRVFADALTQAELEAEWVSPSAVLTAWADWPLVTGDDLTDHSGNGRNLTPVGAAPSTEDGPPLSSSYDKTGGAAAMAAGSGAAVRVSAAVHARTGGAAALGAGVGAVALVGPATHVRTGGGAALGTGVGTKSVFVPGPIRGRLRAGVPVAVGRLHAGAETATAG